MGFSFANLTRWLLPAGMALAVAYTAAAQHAGRRPGQAILFSSADDDDVSSNMPSLTAKPPGTLDFANAIQSPAANSGAASDTEPPPEPPMPIISPAQAQRMQRLLDQRKNWALQTPEEILGASAQEKIPGIQDRDAFGQPKNESVVMRYYKRQEQSRSRTNIDNYGTVDSAPHRDFSGGQESQVNPSMWTPAGGRPENPPLMVQILNGAQNSRFVPVQARESDWSKSFGLPAPPPKATAEQQAAMEQFKQLLQPHSSPGDAAKATALGSPIFFSPSTAPSLASGQPGMIPIGASFTPLSGGLGVPSELPLLPGLLGTNAAVPAFEPEWKPQAPPWASSAPQLGVMPQRKF